MVQRVSNLQFTRLIVVSELNYREVQADGVREKVAILYHSVTDEADESKGGKTHGWMEREPAEIVAIDNAAIYDCPAIKELGISDPDGLRDYVRGKLETRLEDVQKSEFKADYKVELAAVIREQLKDLDKANMVVVGGIHRSMAMPDVIAKWRHDNRSTDKSLHIKFTENVPCEVLSPVDWADLFAQAHEKNGRAMSQIGFTFVDLIRLAIYVMSSLFENVTFFRSFVMTGNKRITPAEMSALKAEGKVKDGGSKFSLPWAIADLHTRFPELDILKRCSIPVNTTDPELKKIRVGTAKGDAKSRLEYGPLDSTDIHRNINYFRACASKETAEKLRNGSQFKEPKAGSEPAICFATGIYWTAEQRAAWWNGNCPDHPDNAKGMPTQIKKETKVDDERVVNVADKSDIPLMKMVADAFLSKDGNKSTITDFQQQNRQPLLVADGFFNLTKSDPATTAAMTKIVTGLQAVKDKNKDVFLKLCSDVLSVIDEAVGTLKADTAPPESGSKSPPKAGSKSPPKGGSKSPPKAESKSPKKATTRK